MKKKFFNSFSVRISLRFMFVVTFIVVILSLGFLFFSRTMVLKSQEVELKKAEDVLFKKISELSSDENVRPKYGASLGTIPELPYYLTYIIYDYDNLALLATNDPFLPLLEDSQGKAKHLFIKNYFFDGDLDILYFAKFHTNEKNNNIIIASVLNMDNNSIATIFDSLPLAIISLAVPILAISFLLSLFLTRNTIKPVVKITKKVSGMSLDNLSELPVSGFNDELDNLSKTFNSLFQKIKTDFDRERQFSSDVSHELNTPLTVISGQAGLLLRWGKDNPKQLEKSLNAIKSEAKTMQAIIANLLQISRIESGRVKPQIAEVSVTSLFSWLEEEFAAIAPDASLIIEDNDIMLNTDPEMLHQILTILITNSIKYAGESSTIRLSAKREGNSIIIGQSDDGPGFSEEAIPHLFERFYRADEAHSRKISGSGLGLAIAQTLCTALGAKIKARNMVPHGAGFSIEFM